MAAIKPIIYAIAPFDATRDFTVTFIYNASQVFGRHVIIKNNETSAVVSDFKTDNNTENRMRQEHVIPAGTLENGVTYNISLSVYDSKNVESPVSNVVVFSCYSTPVLAFTNLNSGAVIGTPNYTFTLSYSQAEDLVLDSYTVDLYDFSRSNLLYTTGTCYDNALEAVVNGMTDNESYYIHAYGETVNGIFAETEYIYFTVDYVAPEVFSLLNLENIPEEGSVKLDSNYVLIEGHSDGDITYENGSADLTGGDVVTFDEGFELNAPNTIIVKLSDIAAGTEFLTVSNGVSAIRLVWRVGDFGEGNKNYVELTIDTKLNANKSYQYYTISNRIDPPAAGEQIEMRIQRIDGNFNLEIRKAVTA